MHHGHDRPGRYRYPVAVSQQLGDPLDRNVLADHQIADQCPQVRAIASRTGRLGREQRCRLVSAVAALALRTMLDGCHHNRREIEHLAPDLPGDRRVGKIIPTSLAVVRRVVDDLVGIGDRWEVLAQSTGLLAGLFTRTAAARLGRGLRVPVRGGRLRRVLRVHPEPRPQPCVVRRQDDVCSGQFVQPYTEFNDLVPQMLVLHRQLGVGRLPVGLGRGCVGRNSLRYARRCPRWWTVPLQGVISIGREGAERSSPEAETVEVVGPQDRLFPWASVTKPVTALAVLVAIEEGTLSLDLPAGPPGSTIRHLLAHASGLGPDRGPPLAKPHTRRIYSNFGYDVLADVLVQRSGMSFRDYVTHGVLLSLIHI